MRALRSAALITTQPAITQTVEYRDLRYTIALRPELAVTGPPPWCIDIDGAWYRLGFEAADAGDEARRFFHESMRSSLTRRTPVFLATMRYSLMLSIDAVAIRSYPMQISGDRWPVWMFESAGRPASECGSIASEQTLADVEDLAKIWLRSAPG